MRLMMLIAYLWAQNGFSQEQEEPPQDTKAEVIDVLNVVVISGTRAESKLSDSPVPVSVVTNKEIQNAGQTDIPGLLARLPEVDLLRIGRSQTEVSLRGKGITFNRRLLVLTNNRTEYNDLFGTTFWHAMALNPMDIDRIEVVRGPASALFGANAFSGVVNIITKSAETNSLTFQASGGTHANAQAQAAFEKVTVGSGFRVSAGYEQADSYESDVFFQGFNHYSTTNNLVRNEDSLEMGRINGQWVWKPNNEMILKTEVAYADGQIEVIPQPGLPRAPWDVQKLDLIADFQWQVADAWSLQFLGYRNEFQYSTELLPSSTSLTAYRPDPDNPNSNDGRYFFPALNNPGLFDGKVETLDGTLQFVGDALFGNLKWVAGAEYRKIDHQGTFQPEENSPVEGASLVANTDKNITSFFGNITYRLLSDRWLIGLGYRNDHDSTTGGDYGYTASLNYYPQEHMYFRLSQRRAFRAPSLFELFSQVTVNVPNQNHSVRFIGNPELENEAIESIDLSWTTTYEAWQIQMEVFREKYKGLIGNPDSGILEDIEFDPVTQQFTTTTTFQNLADADSWGAQIGLFWRINPKFRLNSNLRYEKPDGLNDLSGETFFTPQWKAVLGATYRFTEFWQLYMEDLYVGKTKDAELDRDDPSASFTRLNQESYNLVNLNLTYQIPRFQSVALYFSGWNILDDTHVAYYEFDPVLQGVGEEFGREIMGGMTWKF